MAKNPATAKASSLDEKHFEFVCSQIRYFAERINTTFEFFVKLYGAILGGAVWLSLQPGISTDKAAGLVIASDVLVFFLTGHSCFRLWDNVRAWQNYRKRQSQLNTEVTPPRMWPTHIEEAVETLMMIAAAGFFCIFNPFSY